MKITSGRFWRVQQFSRACSADSAVSTARPCCSSMPLRITRAERESSTIRARLPVVILYLPQEGGPTATTSPAFYLDPAGKPIPANASSPERARGMLWISH